MRRILIIGTAAALAACATTSYDERAELLAKPINCETADEDIVALTEALPSNSERLRSALQSVTPVGIATGAIRREYRDRAATATGKTEREINGRIADIYEACSPTEDGDS